MNASFSKKNYPNSVRMRPALLTVGVVITLVVIVSIMVVLFYSLVSKRNEAKSKDDAIQTVASNADIGWYQNAQSAKSTTTTPIAPLSTLSSKKLMPGVASNQATSNPNKEEKIQPATAPITSNQLVGQQFYKNVQNASYGSVPSNSTTTKVPAEDPGQQAQKGDFLKAAASSQEDDYLHATLKDSISTYEVQAGSVISALLITGINSDLPGQITAQVKTPVYDSISGRYKLIPQGARLIGLYDSSIVYGQERVLVAWKRIIFPNGKSMDLEGMPGVDLSGYSGFNDQVNNHYSKIFGSVILMSILSSGAQLSQPQQSVDNNQEPTVNQMIAQSLGTNISNTSTMMLRKNISIPPTLEIRPGYEFNVMVTRDMVFPSPYEGYSP